VFTVCLVKFAKDMKGNCSAQVRTAYVANHLADISFTNLFAKPIPLTEEGACKVQAWCRIEDEVNNKRKERVEYGGKF